MAVVTFDEKEVAGKIERLRGNTKWLYEHMGDLKKGYGDKFVAVDDRRVIVSDPDINNLVSMLKERYTAIDTFAIEFIPNEDIILVI